MKITCSTLECGLPLDCEGISVIEVASPSLLARVMRSMLQLGEGMEPAEAFYLATDVQTLPASKHLTIITDLFHMDINSRKLLNILYKQVEQLVDEDPQSYIAFHQSKQNLLAKFDTICNTISVELARDEGDCLADFCKYVNLRVAVDNTKSIVEQLECWMDVMAEWMPGQVLVLFNLTSVVSKEDAELLFQYAMYTKTTLLLIEPYAGQALRMHERRWVIGEDYDDYLLS